MKSPRHFQLHKCEGYFRLSSIHRNLPVFKSAYLWTDSLAYGFDFRDSVAAIGVANQLKAWLQLVLNSDEEITVVTLMGNACERLAKQAEEYRSRV